MFNAEVLQLIDKNLQLRNERPIIGLSDFSEIFNNQFLKNTLKYLKKMKFSKNKTDLVEQFIKYTNEGFKTTDCYFILNNAISQKQAESLFIVKHYSCVNFQIRTLTETVLLQPKYFHYCNFKNLIKYQVIKKLEGKFMNEVGYVIIVLDILEISNGKILCDSQSAQYNVKLSCLLFNCQKNNIISILVQKVSETGINGVCGPLNVVIPKTPTDFIGPDLEFDENVYKNNDSSVTIEPGDFVIAKIEGFPPSKPIIIASIKNDWLG